MLQNGLQGRTLQGVGVGQLDGGGILRLTLTESFSLRGFLSGLRGYRFEDALDRASF